MDPRTTWREACAGARRWGIVTLLALLVPAYASAQTSVADSVVNRATVRALDALGQPVVHTDGATTPVTWTAQLDVTAGTTVSARAGRRVVFDHTITNLGNFTDTYRVSASDDLGWTLDVRSPADTTLSGTPWITPPVPPGAAIPVQLVVQVPPGAGVGDVDTATLIVASQRVPAETRSVQDVVRVADAVLDPLLLRVDPEPTVPPGAVLRYTLDFGNPDPSNALQQVRWVDTLAVHLEPPFNLTDGSVSDQAVPGRSIDVQASYDATAHAVTWSATSLPAGFRGTLAFEARVRGSTPEGTHIDNTVRASGTNLPPQRSNTVRVTVVPPVLDLVASTATPQAEPGDVVLFLVDLTNASQAFALDDVDVDFTLPAGFRFAQRGSTSGGAPFDGAPASSRTARMRVSLAVGGAHRWVFAAVVGEGVRQGVHRAVATARVAVLQDLVLTDTADTVVHVTRSLQLDGTIVGRVYVDDDRNGTPGEHEGLPHVRVHLEDGTWSLTDIRGRFHLEGVRPGVHVLRVEQGALPVTLTFGDSTSSRSGRTRFVDVRPGEVRKVNFRATSRAELPRPKYEVIAGSEVWQLHDHSVFAGEGSDVRPEMRRWLEQLARGRASSVAPRRKPPHAFAQESSRNIPVEDTAPVPPDMRRRTLDMESLSDALDIAPPLPFHVAVRALEPSLRTAPVAADTSQAAVDKTRAAVDTLQVRARVAALARVLGLASAPQAAKVSSDTLATRLRLEQLALTVDAAPAILEPAYGEVTGRDRVRLLVKLPLDATPHLRVNEKEISAAFIGTRVEHAEHNVLLLEYVGVPLQAGPNTVTLEACHPSEPCVSRRRTLMRTGPAAQLRVEAASTPADGASEPELQIHLLDAYGNHVSHLRFVTVEAEGEVVGSDADPQRDGFQVAVEGGRGSVRLGPAHEAGDRRVRVRFAELEQEVYVRFLAAPRDWVVTGSGQVSLAARSRAQTTTPDQAPRGIDARAGLFAQGRVGLDGQLTVGIDSEEQGETLFGEDDRAALFPALGDDAAHGDMTASRWPVYLRYDAPEGFARVGDFRTGWSDVELGRFDRSLTGFDGAWIAAGGRTRVHGFAAASRQAAVRDEMPGRGVSGPYALSARPIQIHSERLFIETRHRIHTERVIASRPLVRNHDYTIDYTSGSIQLAEALNGADANFNPMYLVVLYATLEPRPSEPLWGVRGTTGWGSLQSGLVAVREATAAGTRMLLGTDGSWAVQPDVVVGYEYARSIGLLDDDAFRIDVRDQDVLGGRVRAYYREIGEHFRNESRTGALEQGTRKYGVESRLRLGRNTLAVDGYVREDTRTTNERYALSSDWSRTHGAWTWNTGYALTGERGAVTSRLAHVLSTGARRTLHGRLTLEAGAQKALGEASTAHPTRLALGARARLSRKMDLVARQEWDGSDTHRRATRLGLESRVSEHTSWTSRLENVEGPGDDRTAAWLGTRTRVPLGEAWSVHASAEHGRVFTEQDADQAAWSGGLRWRAPLRAVAFGYEGRTSQATREDGAYVTASLRLGRDWVVLTHDRWRRMRLNDAVQHAHDLSLGWAYRPVGHDRFHWLARVRSLGNPTPTLDPSVSFSRTVASLQATLDVTRRATLVGGHAARFAHASLGTSTARAHTGLSHLRLVYDLGRIDLGFGVRHRGRRDAGDDWSYGAELGTLLVRDLWLVGGYNFVGFMDVDLPADVHAAGAGYVSLRFKFDETLFGAVDVDPPAGSARADDVP